MHWGARRLTDSLLVKVKTVDDQYDVSLVDTVLLAEVELIARVMIAASQSARQLTTEEIDAVLGLPHYGTVPEQTTPRPLP